MAAIRKSALALAIAAIVVGTITITPREADAAWRGRGGWHGGHWGHWHGRHWGHWHGHGWGWGAAPPRPPLCPIRAGEPTKPKTNTARSEAAAERIDLRIQTSLNSEDAGV